jgi:signal transduction histidine kinase
MRQDPAVPGLLHDLNNVFQTLVDAADLLSEDPRHLALSAAILRSIERGRRITLSLQDTRGPLAPFDTILQNAVSFAEDAMLVHRGPAVRFTNHVDSGIDLPGNWAWERVLINLFLNAMHAMPQGGEIQVEARRSPSEVRIVVRDSGCGIPPEILEHLFEAHVSTKNGGGLGLHVVRSIVEHGGGTVHADNRIGQSGAEFTIVLPAASRRKAHA